MTFSTNVRLWLAAVLVAPASLAHARDPGPAQVARRFLAAMERKDRAAVASLLAPDASVEYPFDRSGSVDPAARRRFDGREAVLSGYVDGAFRRIERIDFREESAIPSADGRTAFVEAKGEMRLASGAAYRNLYVMRFDVKDGRITRMREYMNPVAAALAAGLPLGPRSDARLP